MAGVVYRFDNGPVLRHMGRLALLGRKNFEAAKREIGEYFKGEIQRSILGQRLFDGSPMPKSKVAIKEDRKTLWDDGLLFKDYNYQLTPDSVELGSQKVYAAIHHFGGKAGRGHKVTLPARPVMGMTPAHEHEIGDILIDSIRRAQS